jgi:hypothetical protein
VQYKIFCSLDQKNCYEQSDLPLKGVGGPCARVAPPTQSKSDSSLSLHPYKLSPDETSVFVSTHLLTCYPHDCFFTALGSILQHCRRVSSTFEPIATPRSRLVACNLSALDSYVGLTHTVRPKAIRTLTSLLQPEDCCHLVIAHSSYFGKAPLCPHANGFPAPTQQHRTRNARKPS